MEEIVSTQLDRTAQNGVDSPIGPIRGDNTTFIESNTKAVTLGHLKEDCTIPVFSKDNECAISHQEFVETIWDTANDLFSGYQITDPQIRVSHIVKGRVPSAVGKPVGELKAHEKTIYYERMMFLIEIPTIRSVIAGQELTLTLGGVRAYNQENLYGRKSLERFKLFMGFQNQVCLNMCVSSDGFVGDLRVGSLGDLNDRFVDLVKSYEIQCHLESMTLLHESFITQSQFSHLIGRLRLYNHLSEEEKPEGQPLLLTDGQLGSVVKQYCQDYTGARKRQENLSLWQLYNLFTAANKSSYIDTFLGRSVSAYAFAQEVAKSIKDDTELWYLH